MNGRWPHSFSLAYLAQLRNGRAYAKLKRSAVLDDEDMDDLIGAGLPASIFDRSGGDDHGN